MKLVATWVGTLVLLSLFGCAHTESEQARKAAALAGEERYRIWRIYMAGCALAFDRGWMSIHQVLAGKPEPDVLLPRPWTRRHQYPPEDPAPLVGPLSWRGLDP